MSTTTWIVVAGDPAVEDLVRTARSLAGEPGPGAEVVAVVAGPRAAADTVAASGVDRVLWLGEPGAVPAEAYALAVADLVAVAAPAVVLAATRPADRVLAGAVAARLGAALLGGVGAVSATAGTSSTVTVQRDVLGGVAVERLATSGPVVLVLDGGAVAAPGAPVAVEEVAAHPLALTVLESHGPVAAARDLGSAQRVVAVGRGLRVREDLALVDGLATALDAATACSRPLAEGAGFFPKDRYVGVSGRQIAPDLYVALGISGQMQHMVGVRGAGTVVAVNSDQDAPIFREADYAVVGDLYAVVPALVEALAR